MNVLFLSLIDFSSIEKPGLYTDLLREFVNHGHNLYIISPVEKRMKVKTSIIKKNNYQILKVQIGNTQKTNAIEKGISTILLEGQIKNAIKKYLNSTKFNLVIYTTPPITFKNIVSYIKKRDNANTYLLLKDIFPQNAVDLGMFSKDSIIYRYFRSKEKKLYQISDYIGCMSPANVDYLLNHNKYIDSDDVEVCPNSIALNECSLHINISEIRNKYKLPLDKPIFIYGGNLGKPQGVDFIIKCLKANENIPDRHFVICGTGTEYRKLELYINTCSPHNITLINGLHKQDYDELVSVCDIGLIFLDYKFTIPNFPSRLLSYMEAKMPIIACVDESTDIGRVIEDNKFGFYCISDDSNKFKKIIDDIITDKNRIRILGQNAYNYLMDNFTVDKTYNIIMKHFEV